MLDLAGRWVLVVGGGGIAARRVSALLEVGARVRIVAIEANDDLRRMASEDTRVELHLRPYREGDLEGAALVFAATGAADVQKFIAEGAARRGLWVNAADDPAHCSFLMPAILERGPITVSVSTGGESPALAVRLRDELERSLGPEYATAAELLGDLRRNLPPGEARMRALVDLLNGEFLDVLRRNDKKEVERLVSQVRRTITDTLVHKA